MDRTYHDPVKIPIRKRRGILTYNKRSATSLDNFNKNLEGDLDFSDFENLKNLNCYGNKLNNLSTKSCLNLEKINCSNNVITNLEIFINTRKLRNKTIVSLINGETLRKISVVNNNISKTDLSLFSRFVNLEELWLGNSSQERIERGIYNHFYGSLDYLKDLTKLRVLDINNTDIDSGLESLPSTLVQIYCLADKREDAKVKVIAQELNKYGKESKSIIQESNNYFALLEK
jgi:Leucine-rich repeat (LRR) protein